MKRKNKPKTRKVRTLTEEEFVGAGGTYDSSGFPIYSLEIFKDKDILITTPANTYDGLQRALDEEEFPMPIREAHPQTSRCPECDSQLRDLRGFVGGFSNAETLRRCHDDWHDQIEIEPDEETGHADFSFSWSEDEAPNLRGAIRQALSFAGNAWSEERPERGEFLYVQVEDAGDKLQLFIEQTISNEIRRRLRTDIDSAKRAAQIFDYVRASHEILLGFDNQPAHAEAVAGELIEMTAPPVLGTVSVELHEEALRPLIAAVIEERLSQVPDPEPEPDPRPGQISFDDKYNEAF